MEFMKSATYIRQALPSDLRAGFITAVVALPLAIAFAIASGVPPVMGLYTAIVAGILGSAFGGSRFSITGPTGAMTVIILSTIQRFGLEGLLLAGLLAGLIQLLFGILKIGRFVAYIPLPVVSGFTAGIGVIIFVGQIANSLGLQVPAEEFIGNTLRDVVLELPAVNLTAVLISAGTIVFLTLVPGLVRKLKFLPNIPPSLPPLVLSVGAVMLAGLSIPTVGAIPHGLPEVTLSSFSLDLARDVLPAALTIALLGAIEALLCAVVCDAMTDTRHDSDRELKAQALSNIVMPFVGGIPATAAIARSAVNIREGARTRGAGVIHALFLLVFMLFLSTLVANIPKAFLAGILMFVSVRMINIEEIRTITRISKQDSLVLLITLGLTVFTDLVFAVQVGMFLAIFLLFVRVVKAGDVSLVTEHDPTSDLYAKVSDRKVLEESVGIYTIHGPFFFGTMSLFERKINEHMHVSRPVIILRMKYVPFIDATGQTRLIEFIRDRRSRGEIVLISGLTEPVRRRLFGDRVFQGVMPREHIFAHSVDALAYAEQHLIARNGQSASN
jgi:SulP family sulfate permease